MKHLPFRVIAPLLIFGLGLMHAFGAPVANESTPAVASAPRAAHRATQAEGSEVVAEYAPVAIEALPLHFPGPRQRYEEDWAPATPLIVVTRGELERGQSLSTAMRAQGISSATIHLIAREMRGTFDFRHAQPGHRYRLNQDPDGQILEFRYETSPEKSLKLTWDGEEYSVVERQSTLQPHLAKVSGGIETSLYEAILAIGEHTSLASSFADIFAWDIDFSRNVRPGDDFEILYEKLYRTDEDGQSVYVRPGRILAARYRGEAGEHEAIFFEPTNGHAGYYRPDGSAIERAFLVAPLEFSRISSSFSTARRHPILGVVRPHRGIDYAASPGTPVWSVAEGTVIYRGWAGASGNLVKIKHRNGYVSYYAHLAGFAKGLKVGNAVGQKQVIGRVGSTGLATGPHVCFRVQKNGRYVNPLDIVSPPAEGVNRDHWPVFKARRDLLLSDLGTTTLVSSDEAL